MKARMFNRRAAKPESKPDEILKALGLKEADRVADIGSGGGYFSFRFAESVGRQGRVYAVDTQADMSEFVQGEAKQRGLENVEPVLVEEDALDLPERVDLIFMRNVTHHIEDRVRYFGNLRDSLKPGGRVAIIEYTGGSRFSFRGIFGHFVPKPRLIGEMKEAGFNIEEDLDFLPEQSFTVYSVKAWS
jgi:ubiquinone/menaquinone biosynthesis C-methylase UbiE